ncbi:unknown [Bacteroides caccae CAG:21]|nr:unknown [Bacteroides caccae CAG:21]
MNPAGIPTPYQKKPQLFLRIHHKDGESASFLPLGHPNPIIGLISPLAHMPALGKGDNTLLGNMLHQSIVFYFFQILLASISQAQFYLCY